jgi:hypothetical protein
MTAKEKIESLKKVSLKLAVGNTPEELALATETVSFDFIFGTGVNGITPFEYELVNKAPGEQFQFVVQGSEFHRFFEHLTQSIHQIVGHCDSDVYLQGYVDQVSTPSNREIVKAMAGLSGCDDGCCGDGCCGH